MVHYQHSTPTVFDCKLLYLITGLHISVSYNFADPHIRILPQP